MKDNTFEVPYGNILADLINQAEQADGPRQVDPWGLLAEIAAAYRAGTEK